MHSADWPTTALSGRLSRSIAIAVEAAVAIGHGFADLDLFSRSLSGVPAFAERIPAEFGRLQDVIDSGDLRNPTEADGLIIIEMRRLCPATQAGAADVPFLWDRKPQGRNDRPLAGGGLDGRDFPERHYLAPA